MAYLYTLKLDLPQKDFDLFYLVGIDNLKICVYQL